MRSLTESSIQNLSTATGTPSGEQNSALRAWMRLASKSARELKQRFEESWHMPRKVGSMCSYGFVYCMHVAKLALECGWIHTP